MLPTLVEDTRREIVAMGALVYLFLIGIVLNGVYGHGRLKKSQAALRSAFDQDLYENVLDSEQCEAQLTFLANNNLRNQCEFIF